MKIYKQKNARVSLLSHQIKAKIPHNSLASSIIISTSALCTFDFAKKIPKKAHFPLRASSTHSSV